jgi:zinc transporter ZupT
MHRGVLKLRGVNTSPVGGGGSEHGRLFDICIPAFAVGALMATAVFLIFPEALHLIEGKHAEEEDAHDDHGEDAIGGGEEVDDHFGHDHRFLQDEDAHAGHDGGDDESINAAKFGCAVLGGFLLPVVLSIIFHHTDTIKEEDDVSAAPQELKEEEDCESCKEKDADVETGVWIKSGGDCREGTDCDAAVPVANATPAPQGIPPTTIIQKIQDDSGPQDLCPCEVCEEDALTPKPEAEAQLVTKTKTFINYRLGATILIGDALHNFADGLFIGAALLTCSWGTAMSIMMVTLFHEIAQELADFIILTRYVGLSVVRACLLNFLSGLSVCLGGITVLAGNPTDEAIGILLAMAGGVYVNIAASETIPRLESFVKDRGDRVLTLVSFIVGTVPIGLVLLNHKHCG